MVTRHDLACLSACLRARCSDTFPQHRTGGVTNEARQSRPLLDTPHAFAQHPFLTSQCSACADAYTEPLGGSRWSMRAVPIASHSDP
jgi:hypothetical protein